MSFLFTSCHLRILEKEPRSTYCGHMSTNPQKSTMLSLELFEKEVIVSTDQSVLKPFHTYPTCFLTCCIKHPFVCLHASRICQEQCNSMPQPSQDLGTPHSPSTLKHQFSAPAAPPALFLQIPWSISRRSSQQLQTCRRMICSSQQCHSTAVTSLGRTASWARQKIEKCRIFSSHMPCPDGCNFTILSLQAWSGCR